MSLTPFPRIDVLALVEHTKDRHIDDLHVYFGVAAERR